MAVSGNTKGVKGGSTLWRMLLVHEVEETERISKWKQVDKLHTCSAFVAWMELPLWTSIGGYA